MDQLLSAAAPGTSSPRLRTNSSTSSAHGTLPPTRPKNSTGRATLQAPAAHRPPVAPCSSPPPRTPAASRASRADAAVGNGNSVIGRSSPTPCRARAPAPPPPSESAPRCRSPPARISASSVRQLSKRAPRAPPAGTWPPASARAAPARPAPGGSSSPGCRASPPCPHRPFRRRRRPPPPANSTGSIICPINPSASTITGFRYASASSNASAVRSAISCTEYGASTSVL